MVYDVVLVAKKNLNTGEDEYEDEEDLGVFEGPRTEK
jgi:hypothetical protein